MTTVHRLCCRSPSNVTRLTRPRSPNASRASGTRSAAVTAPSDHIREEDAALAAIDSFDSAHATVVHGHHAVVERLRRDELEPARAGQPALVKRRAVAGDPGM